MTTPKLVLTSVIWLIQTSISLVAVNIARRCLGSTHHKKS
jgi:hypothetical protein